MGDPEWGVGKKALGAPGAVAIICEERSIVVLAPMEVKKGKKAGTSK